MMICEPMQNSSLTFDRSNDIERLASELIDGILIRKLAKRWPTDNAYVYQIDRDRIKELIDSKKRSSK